MAALDEKVQVTINFSDTLITRAGFGSVGVQSETVASGSPRVESFTSLSSLATKYAASTKVYKASNALFAAALASGRTTPTLKIIGRMTKTTVTVDTAVDATAYTLTIAGEDIVFTSGVSTTTQLIVDGLIAAIEASAQGLLVTATGLTSATFVIQPRSENQTITEADSNLTAADSTETITQGFNGAVAQDSDWYFVVQTARTSAELQETNTWVSGQEKLFFYSSEEVGALATTQTDTFGVLAAASAGRAAGLWHHQGGFDFSVASGVIASGVATFTTSSAHNLRNDDKLTLAGVLVDASPSTELNTEHTVTVASNTTFTVTTTASGTITGTMTAFARTAFAEAGWIGRMATGPTGGESWADKTLSGIPTSNAFINDTAKVNLSAKKGNWYLALAGVGVTGSSKSTAGGGGVLHSGRFIDIQWGIDKLKARVQEEIFALMANTAGISYTADGLNTVEGAILAAGAELLNDGFLTTTEGQPLVVSMPNLNDISSTDKVARLLKDITVTGTVAGKVHNVELTINLNP